MLLRIPTCPKIPAAKMGAASGSDTPAKGTPFSFRNMVVFSLGLDAKQCLKH